MNYGYDPEVPAGFQDADIEMAELREQAHEAELAEAEKERAALGWDLVWTYTELPQLTDKELETRLHRIDLDGLEGAIRNAHYAEGKYRRMYEEGPR